MFDTLDERFLDMPSFAVEKCKELLCDMAKISADALKKATVLLDEYTNEKFKEVESLEKSGDKYEDKISSYLLKLSSNQLNSKDSKVVTELLHCVGDIERISDHALNIAEAAKEIYDKKLDFSDKARNDIKIIAAATMECLDLAIASLVNEDAVIAKRVEPLEQVIDRLKRKIKSGHVERLKHGDCTMELGFILSDLLTNYERVSDHCSNIAVCYIEVENDSFQTHEYLHSLETGEGTEFSDMYKEYKEKYYIG